MIGLSKSRILLHRQCPKRLWLHVNRPDLIVEDQGVTSRLAVGRDVGEVARGLYPGGILIDTLDAKQALASTALALSGDKRQAVFEAAFAHDGVFIRADLLLPIRGGYRLVEVKSATEVKPYHLDAAAVQSWVAGQAGLGVKRVEIAHVDTSFIYPGNNQYDGLFAYAEVTADVQPLQREVPKWIKAARRTLAGKKEPGVEPGKQCRDPFACPFIGYCAPESEDGYPPEILPHREGKALAAELRTDGYTDLRKVPGKRITPPKFKRIWRVTKSGKFELDPEAGEVLSALSYPRYYLDFETIDFAAPIWPGAKPYRQIPFQWSCHIERKNGTTLHRSFLVKDATDPRRAFAEALLATLKSRGPVLVYNAGFECGCLRELAADFPDLAPALNAISNQVVDLLVIARQHYYHRDMYGSWSLKSVLPTIAPELAYDDLEVANGGMAQEAFLEMLHPETPAARARELRQALLTYCERDTWALVRMAHFFQER